MPARHALRSSEGRRWRHRTPRASLLLASTGCLHGFGWLVVVGVGAEYPRIRKSRARTAEACKFRMGVCVQVSVETRFARKARTTSAGAWRSSSSRPVLAETQGAASTRTAAAPLAVALSVSDNLGSAAPSGSTARLVSERSPGRRRGRPWQDTECRQHDGAASMAAKDEDVPSAADAQSPIARRRCPAPEPRWSGGTTPSACRSESFRRNPLSEARSA
jgi:hypothetical protein